MAPVDGDVQWAHLLDAFLVGLATATAAAIVAGVVALARFIHREDEHRMRQLDHMTELSATLHRRQNRVIIWARRVGRRVGIPFPIDDGEDDPDKWDEDEWDDEGLR